MAVSNTEKRIPAIAAARGVLNRSRSGGERCIISCSMEDTFTLQWVPGTCRAGALYAYVLTPRWLSRKNDGIPLFEGCLRDGVILPHQAEECLLDFGLMKKKELRE